MKRENGKLRESAQKEVPKEPLKQTRNQKLLKKLFVIQQKIIATTSLETLKKASKYMRPIDYEHVVIERADADFICGYPICSSILSTTRVSLFGEPLSLHTYAYCSKSCRASSMFYMRQLNTDPIYVRNLEKIVEVTVVPLSSSLPEVSPSIDPLSQYVNDLYNSLPKPESELVIIENDVSSVPVCAPINRNDIEGFVPGGFQPEKIILSRFGSLWTLIDHLTTTSTRAFFNNTEFETTNDDDDVSLMRREIFSVNLLSKLASFKQVHKINLELADSFIDIIKTLDSKWLKNVDSKDVDNFIVILFIAIIKRDGVHFNMNSVQHGLGFSPLEVNLLVELLFK